MARISLVGNLTRNPELSFTNKGTALCKITVADNYKANRDAEPEVSFIDVTLWGTLAENLANTCTKGSRVFVEGRLKQESWEKDGQQRSKLVVVADNAGPDLRFATANLTNVGKRESSAPADDDSPF